MPLRFLSFFLSLLAGAYLLSACDRPKTQTITTTTVRPGPTTTPILASTQPSTRPTFSFLAINGQETRFPPARLLLVHAEPYVELLLFSDDPKDALGSNYEGNRYYFDLKLRDVTLDQLPSADLHAQLPSTERIDAPDGIYLEGDRRYLQPADWRCAFSRQGATWFIHIEGQFLLFPSREDTPLPQKVHVTGLLSADLESRKPRRPDPTTKPVERR